MKNLFLIILITLSITSCKKEDVQPQQSQALTIEQINAQAVNAIREVNLDNLFRSKVPIVVDQLNPAAWDTNGHTVTSVLWASHKPFLIVFNKINKTDTYSESSNLPNHGSYSCVIVSHYYGTYLENSNVVIPIIEGDTIHVNGYDSNAVKVYEENVIILKGV